MKIYNCPQGSSEWLTLRAGIPTASEFDCILTPKGKPSASVERLLYSLLAERIMQRPRVEAVSTWMQRGNELEADAVAFYELTRETETTPVGFISNDEHTWGASPDRLVGEDGLLEIKCPSEHIHVSYLLKKAIDQAYFPQVQGQLWISERKWLDILSFHPEMPQALVRVERDEEYIALLSDGVSQFSVILESYSRELMERGWIKAWPIPMDIHAPELASSEGLISAEDLAYVESLAAADAHASEAPPGAPEVKSGPPFTAQSKSIPEASPLMQGLGGGMVPIDYSKDPPPPCPKCGGPTVFKAAGRFKNVRWNDGWKCDARPQNCKQRKQKGAWVDAAEYHASCLDLPQQKGADATPERSQEPASPSQDDLGMEEFRKTMLSLQRRNPRPFLTKLAEWSFTSLDEMVEILPDEERAGRIEAMRGVVRIIK